MIALMIALCNDPPIDTLVLQKTAIKWSAPLLWAPNRGGNPLFSFLKGGNPTLKIIWVYKAFWIELKNNIFLKVYKTYLIDTVKLLIKIIGAFYAMNKTTPNSLFSTLKRHFRLFLVAILDFM